jgi:hypothetical protein
MTFLRIVMPLWVSLEHDLFRKTASTFRNHALTALHLLRRGLMIELPDRRDVDGRLRHLHVIS